MQPCEFTEKLRNTGVEFPCSDAEYYKFLLNIGCWVAAKLMKRGGKACKKDLPYYVPPEEVEALATRVPWMDVLQDVGTWEAGAKSPLNAVYDCIKAELKTQGWTTDDLKGAPELRNLTTFRRAIDGVTMQKRNDSGYPTGKGMLKVVEVTGELKKQARHWIKNFRLMVAVSTTGSTPEPNGQTEITTEIQEVAGRYYVDMRSGAVTRIEAGEEAKSWDITKYIQQPDPMRELTGKMLGEGVQIKHAVFRTRANTLIDITATR